MSFDPHTTIQRAPHDGENPYAQISRSLIRDENASPLLRFVLIFLLSQKDGWKIKPGQLINLMKPHGIGKDKVYSIFNEGIELGYIEKYTWFVKGLKRTGFRISEAPIFKKTLPRPSQPDADAPDAGETSNKKEHRISKDILKKKEEPPAPPPKRYAEFVKYPNVTKMTFEGYQRLIDKHGKRAVEETMKSLNDYADMKRKKFNEYTNHEAVVNNWITRDKKTPKKTSAVDVEKENQKISERRKKWRKTTASKDS